ncbi:MAG: RIP metalloprotease RseP [Bacteroidales bacterium]|nr:RIP metalloprotease RseP [Bacteroidales bacterium]MCF8386296.1 RIP metalloprotease RseP [Bacteroidales bacterium]MCF8398173.1 RIP metalloprotease RseP [Bacteroidales bacterium]
MEILIKVLQLLLSLSILVVFHEMGHFVAAKIFKTRVEKFYLFFNPWFSIFKFKKGDTEYGMGWLPLGGYVKISGMIDESMDKEQMKKPPEPHEFRSKPAWQRLIIMLGGVIVNVILAMVIYVFMLSIWGEQYLPTSEANKYGITVDSLAYEMGLRNGDKIISIDGKEVEDFSKVPVTLILDEAKSIQVIRNEKNVNIEIPKGSLGKLVKKKTPDFISVGFPFEVSKFTKDSPAEKAGIQLDDKIIGINGKQIMYFSEFVREIPQYKGQEATITVVRKMDTLDIPVQISEQGTIGAYRKDIKEYFTFKEKNYNFLQAIPAGVLKAYKGIGDYLKQLKLLFSPEVKAYESVGGFITIGSIFPATWDWQQFWRLTAFLSIMLAILNVLPIPALDGGHVMFLLYEIIAGRKPSDKFMEYAQVAGMVILFALLIWANGNDVIRLFK